MLKFFKNLTYLQKFLVRNLSLIIVIFPILALLFYGGFVSMFITYKQDSYVKKEIKKIENQILTEQKKFLKDKAKNIKSFIEFSERKSYELVQKEIKAIVDMAYNIAINIIEKNQYVLTKKEKKEIVKLSLEKVEFNDNRGYLFINDLNSKVIMHPFIPSLEGKYIGDRVDGNGKKFIKEFEKIIKNSKKGFVNYSWYKPNAGFINMYEKITYIRKFDYFNWYIGAGEYLDNIKRDVQKDIFTFLESVKLYESGFIFIFDKRGRLVKHPCAKEFLNVEDEEVQSKGEEILKKFKEASRSDKFVYYVGKDCLTNKFLNKIAFVYHVKSFGWYIVVSKNLSDIEQTLSSAKKSLIQKIDSESTLNIELLLVISLISLILSFYLSIIINKTLKMYESELENNQKTMLYQSRLAQAGELLSMIAHQWRQPLAKIAAVVIGLRLEIMRGKAKDSEIDIKLEKIENYTEHLSDTIDDFKNFYKPKKSKESVLIAPLIEKSIDFLENSIKRKSITIKKKFKNDSEIYIFPNELVQVIINLIQNAIDASSLKSTIKIGLDTDEKSVIISISDSAGGVKKELLGKIFEPYFTTKEGTSSLGLGLYMSKIIVERHLESVLEVKNSKLGAVFTVRLKKLTKRQ